MNSCVASFDEIAVLKFPVMPREARIEHPAEVRRYLAQHIKDVNGIANLIHPPQSPDLNPMEGVWNILKQRMRRRTWGSLEELKEVLQDEWSKTTMQEVRARITNMPRRCKLLVETGGAPIKTALW
jgi:hypothetical protein